MPFEAETLDMEGFDEGDAAESAEAAPRKGPRISSSYMPRSFGQQPPVSQTQLQAALGRVDNNLRKVSDVETAINSRVSSLASAAKKETADRKKSIDSQVKDLNQKLQLLALLPLLIAPPAGTLQGGVQVQDASGKLSNQVAIPDTNKLDAILPLLLVSGLGGTGSGGGLFGDGSGGSDSGLLLLALVLAFAKP